MKIHRATIHRISSHFGFHSITLKTDNPVVFDPGQYILASTVTGGDDPIPTSLFMEGVDGDEVSICSPSPESWIPGQELSFKGPLGHGFHLPGLLRRMALIGLDDHPGRLMSLVQVGRLMKADIVLAGEFSSNSVMTHDIPPQVELAGLDQLSELIAWSDFVAMDIPLERMQHLEEILVDTALKKVNRDIQILVHASMPCGGIAECGICAVKTKRGYKLACQDGPVFNLADLSFT
jgi:dihydroorotate dehydrogenase electron transfer subunit